MLYFFVATIVLQLTVANGFFEGCPMDREQRVGNDRVFDILLNFYNDLNFVQASTELPEGQNIERVVNELKSVFPSYSEWPQIYQAIELLRIGDFRGAAVLLGTATLMEQLIYTPVPTSLRTYMHYFASEAFRLLGFIGDASEEIIEALNARSESKGISLNELEGLCGLVLIQRVSKFNQEMDILYRSNTDLNHLRMAHSDLKGKIDAFKDMKSLELSRMFGSNRRIFPALRRREIGAVRPIPPPPVDDSETDDQWPVTPVLDIFNGRSVAKASVEGILCEFAQKLDVIIQKPREDKRTYYSSLIGQLRQIDAGYAEQFDTEVVQNLVTNPQKNPFDYIVLFDRQSTLNLPDNLFKPLKTYARYFEATIYRQKSDCDDIVYAERLLEDIKTIRYTERGVSLDKLHELEGNILIKLMKCFRLRLISTYRLNGDESLHEIANKRARFGSCKSHFPGL